MSNTLLPSMPDVSPRVALLLSLALVAGFSVWLVLAYGLEDYAVQLVPGFAAALGAFVIALAWERDREATRAVEGAKRVTEEHVVEVSRRLRTVREELKVNRKSFQDAEQPLRAGVWAVNPQLLDGAWTASASALAELLAHYELTADIARVYGRIEELRWRLRTRTETRVNTLDTITIALVDELGPEVDALLPRIDAEIANPSVRFGGIVQRVALQGAVAAGATIETKVIRADEER